MKWKGAAASASDLAEHLVGSWKAQHMKNPKFLIGLTLAGLAAALVIVALVPRAPREPVYQGRSLRAAKAARK
jgi:hypothetical protein